MKQYMFDKLVALKGKSTDKVDPFIAKKRLSICYDCTTPKGNKTVTRTGNCKYCGCFVKEKVKYKEEECPLNKW